MHPIFMYIEKNYRDNYIYVYIYYKLAVFIKIFIFRNNYLEEGDILLLT